MKKINIIKKRTYSKKKEVITFVYAAILLLSVPIYTLFRAQDIQGFWQHTIYMLTTASLYGLLLCIFKKRHALWLLTPMLLLYLVDFIYTLMYGYASNLLWVYTAIVAEPGESAELITVYFPLILIVLGIWGAYCFLTYRYTEKRYIASPRTRLILGCVSVGWLLIATVCTTVYGLTDRLPAFQTVLKICPINDIYNLARITGIRHMAHSGQEHLANYDMQATTTAQEDEIVVLVLGETGRYANWQLNGYERETSPRLMARAEEILSYDSCYTVANLTTVSVPMMLSRTTPHNIESYYDEPSVVGAFQRAGYRTAWIADQSFNNPFLLYISGTCDYLFYHDLHNLSFDDMELVEPLRDCLSSLEGKQMVVMHTLGSHFKYSSRYPEGDSYFKPDLYDVSGKDVLALRDFDGITIDRRHPQSSIAKVAKRILTNSYDNTIRHIDSFLDSVITTLQESERPVVMLYVADHGENLLDDDNHRILHGQESNSVYEYHVPLFLWASDRYKQRYPERWQTMADNQNKKISTMNIYHTLLDLGGVIVPGYQSDMSIVSRTLQPDSVLYRLDGNLRICVQPYD